ncbi:uncharacterized protein SPPG_03722 [Spizellomyces punctatus DAOM BR117]|uniref:Uncharacterized protein n=1 Tax=Spizellomyces punctatus (strain DAOM BR117) TaxID=645134 RepID=A0A0L0HHP6_SPIPD|nr:uncharacterized protein SPPG_03722 [Spizellomyces punctatus DAOM BR117]KND00598.1 hypothetical protein SPPG_03722 [Spizellomyces punctatus DAOM BR117]|eukprot:XP_016608637.1 hypothetical protein SPPG_03722 [Spizellomyces punctatus DAOM BR117]
MLNPATVLILERLAASFCVGAVLMDCLYMFISLPALKLKGTIRVLWLVAYLGLIMDASISWFNINWAVAGGSILVYNIMMFSTPLRDLTHRTFLNLITVRRLRSVLPNMPVAVYYVAGCGWLVLCVLEFYFFFRDVPDMDLWTTPIIDTPSFAKELRITLLTLSFVTLILSNTTDFIILHKVIATKSALDGDKSKKRFIGTIYMRCIICSIIMCLVEWALGICQSIGIVKFAAAYLSKVNLSITLHSFFFFTDTLYEISHEFIDPSLIPAQIPIRTVNISED